MLIFFEVIGIHILIIICVIKLTPSTEYFLFYDLILQYHLKDYPIIHSKRMKKMKHSERNIN